MCYHGGFGFAGSVPFTHTGAGDYTSDHVYDTLPMNSSELSCLNRLASDYLYRYLRLGATKLHEASRAMAHQTLYDSHDHPCPRY